MQKSDSFQKQKFYNSFYFKLNYIETKKSVFIKLNMKINSYLLLSQLEYE